MYKFLIIFLLLPALLFSQTITDINGYDWVKYDENARIFVVIGMCLSSYTILQMLLNDGVLTLEQTSRYNFGGEDTKTIAAEITIFYEKTSCFDYPVYIVAFFRNEWKYRDNWPLWSEKKGVWK